eukprot:CAMPEP_0196577040 /NCGR_PEP_ID=MMETSP1081-20130531/6184_1 /TAXON_ID=36882 /ORGANISM="Pyramimonas amylifera, Strain CCMP720" /LENGTH=69 /DNA_ID=CAMNT_0041895837 /DNA_START=271 /DNA_END=480 /DNA_ORIENTATION=-
MCLPTKLVAAEKALLAASGIGSAAVGSAVAVLTYADDANRNHVDVSFKKMSVESLWNSLSSWDLELKLK